MEREADQKQLQELETTLQLYDRHNTQLCEDVAHDKARIKGQCYSMNALVAQLGEDLIYELRYQPPRDKY